MLTEGMYPPSHWCALLYFLRHAFGETIRIDVGFFFGRSTVMGMREPRKVERAMVRLPRLFLCIEILS